MGGIVAIFSIFIEFFSLNTTKHPNIKSLIAKLYSVALNNNYYAKLFNEISSNNLLPNNYIIENLITFNKILEFNNLKTIDIREFILNQNTPKHDLQFIYDFCHQYQLEEKIGNGNSWLKNNNDKVHQIYSKALSIGLFGNKDTEIVEMIKENTWLKFVENMNKLDFININIQAEPSTDTDNIDIEQQYQKIVRKINNQSHIQLLKETIIEYSNQITNIANKNPNLNKDIFQFNFTFDCNKKLNHEIMRFYDELEAHEQNIQKLISK